MQAKEHEASEVNNIAATNLNSPSDHVNDSPSEKCNPLKESIDKLTTMLSRHMEHTEETFKNHAAQINAINSTPPPFQNNGRPPPSRNYNNNRRFQNNGRNRYNNNTTGYRQNGPNMAASTTERNEVICFACGGKNHYARNCTSQQRNLNFPGRL